MKCEGLLVGSDDRMRSWLACFAAFYSACNAVSLASEHGSISKLSRTIELTGGLTRIQSSLELAGQDRLRLAFASSVHGNLSHLSAQIKETKRKVDAIKQFQDLKTNAFVYDIDLTQEDTANLTLVLTEIYAHISRPLPAQLEQTTFDGQYFLWQEDLLGGLSTYNDVAEAKVRVKLPTPQSKTFSTPDTFTSSHSAGSATVVYSSKGPVEARTQQPASIHYFEPDPVVSFRDMKRTIQISHWSSSIAFEDNIELINNGPRLKGHFSRLEHARQAYTRRGMSAAPHVLTGLAFPLPPQVFSPYFTDTVGNVSTSHFRPSHELLNTRGRGKKESLLEIRPRYPLLGGWTYNFTIGYLAPLHHYARKGAGGIYHLSLPFATAMKDTPIDRAEVQILLPEGAKLQSISTPFAVDSMLEKTTYTYLDTTGHPTIVLIKTACSDVHNQDILITYSYSLFALLQKPLAVTVATLMFGLTAVGFRRLDWSLTPKI